MSYGYSRTTNLSFDVAVEKITEELSKEGFGVLTTIDVKATLKKKLNEDTRPYVILGACNPHFAHQALQREAELGLLLPCNVIVYENEGGQTVVASIDARKMLSIVGNQELEAVADQVSDRLKAAVERI